MALRILVVEDDADVRDAVRDFLELEGFDVVATDTIAEALRLAAEGPPFALALIDHYLPDGIGSDLCAELKARDHTLRCVMFSASDDAAAPAVRVGADRWLRKPFALAELITGMI